MTSRDYGFLIDIDIERLESRICADYFNPELEP